MKTLAVSFWSHWLVTSTLLAPILGVIAKPVEPMLVFSVRSSPFTLTVAAIGLLLVPTFSAYLPSANRAKAVDWVSSQRLLLRMLQRSST